MPSTAGRRPGGRPAQSWLDRERLAAWTPEEVLLEARALMMNTAPRCTTSSSSAPDRSGWPAPSKPGGTALGRVIDKGALVNSILGYPARMEFFSTPELIEIGGHPFPVQGYKPTREDGARVLPRGRRRARRSTCVSTSACSSVRRRRRRLHRRDRRGHAPRAARRRRDRLLRPAQSPRRARRGPAEGHALLPRAVSATCGSGGGDRRARTRRPRRRSTATATAPR